MQTARHNNHFLLPSKNQGFALMTELASLVIFGFGMLALSTLSEKTVSASSESLQRTHASWMVNSLISRMSMNNAAPTQMDQIIEKGYKVVKEGAINKI